MHMKSIDYMIFYLNGISLKMSRESWKFNIKGFLRDKKDIDNF